MEAVDGPFWIVVRQIPPQDWGWELAEAIAKRLPHGSRRMRSCQSYGPIKAWCCDSCRVMAYTLDLIPPLCHGPSSNSHE